MGTSPCPTTPTPLVLGAEAPDIRRDSIRIFDKNGVEVIRPITESELSSDAADKAGFRHFMQKEIFTQPLAIAETIEGRIIKGRIIEETFGMSAPEIFDKTKVVTVFFRYPPLGMPNADFSRKHADNPEYMSLEEYRREPEEYELELIPLDQGNK